MTIVGSHCSILKGRPKFKVVDWIQDKKKETTVSPGDPQPTSTSSSGRSTKPLSMSSKSSSNTSLRSFNSGSRTSSTSSLRSSNANLRSAGTNNRSTGSNQRSASSVNSRINTTNNQKTSSNVSPRSSYKKPVIASNVPRPRRDSNTKKVTNDLAWVIQRLILHRLGCDFTVNHAWTSAVTIQTP